jgi:PKD repeat protein
MRSSRLRPKRKVVGCLLPRSLAVMVVFLVAAIGLPPPLNAATLECGDPVTEGAPGVTATDALYVLMTAVETRTCEACVCDVDDSGAITATDALLLLRVAVGHEESLACPPCGPPANYAPSVSIGATPATGAAPLEVAFDAEGFDVEGDTLVYTWDFGDGTVREGAASETHSYPNAGSYAVAVTVSDEQGSGSDGVLIDVGTSASSATIGSAGGELALGRLSLSVPAGLLTEDVEIRAVELPSLASAAAADLDPGDFRPIGPAYRIDAALRSKDALRLTLAYEEAELPAGFAAGNLALLLRLHPNAEQVVLVPPVVFTVLPAEVDAVAGTVATDVYATDVTVQVVAAAEPLVISQTLGRTAAREQLEMPALDLPAFGVTFLSPPADPTAMRSDILDALSLAANTMLPRGFDAPPWTTVVVQSLPNQFKPAFVEAAFPLLIVVDRDSYPTTPAGQSIFTLIFHEYFHVLQFWSSNAVSANNFNRWFLEGTAEWASDEVGDSFPYAYNSPDGTRFWQPLQLPVPLGHPLAYETVAFWKWLEQKGGGSITALIDHHRSLTQKMVGNAWVSKSGAQRYFSSLQALYPYVDFFEFAKSSLFRKDYDANETAAGDLWSATELGPRNQLPADFTKPSAVVWLTPSYDAAQPYVITHELAPHWTADAALIRSDAANPVAGTLHLLFNKPVDMDVDVIVIPACGSEEIVRDVQTQPVGTEITVPFGPGEDVVLIVASKRFAEPSGTGEFETWAWVEPGGIVFNVPCCAIEDVHTALSIAGPGDTVLLAPGTYTAPGMLWTDDDEGLWRYPASLVVWRGVTLAGEVVAGQDPPRIILSGYDSGLLALEGSAIRNLRIIAQKYTGVVAMGAHLFSMCQAVISSGIDVNAGLDFVVTDGAASNLAVVDTTFYCAPHGCGATGIQVRGYSPVPPGPVTVDLRNLDVYYYWIGLYYSTDESEPQVTLYADCKDFHDNDTNVQVCNHDCVEMCPALP